MNEENKIEQDLKDEQESTSSTNKLNDGLTFKSSVFRGSVKKVKNLTFNSVSSTHQVIDDDLCVYCNLEKGKDVTTIEQTLSERIKHLEEDLRLTKEKLIRSENLLRTNCYKWTNDSRQLQYWLKLTYELESSHLHGKRIAAEAQLTLAKEGVS